MSRILPLVAFLSAASLSAQIDPQGAHVSLYFPQLADGGTDAQRWQTTLILHNPHPTLTANGALSLLNNDGGPLTLDFGAGPGSSFNLTVPGGATRVYRTTGTNPTIVTGWAYLSTTLPLQATLLFRAIESGVPRVEISALPTLPTRIYRSFATGDLGVAIANPETNDTINVTVTALLSSGLSLGSTSVTLGPLAHLSFNLRNLMPGLPPGFIGTIVVSSQREFVAWTLNSLDGVLSSLPPGQAAWPVAQTDRILLAYSKVLNAARPLVLSAFGVDLFNPQVQLQIDSSQQINASASSDGRLTVSLALAELIADSPSELAFVIGHELGHIVQFRSGRPTLLNANPEHDADIMGLWFGLIAGFDPYGAAGALAKLSMASGTSGVVTQILLDEFEIHGSLGTRIQNLYNNLKFVCSDPALNQACVDYRSVFHPHFPPTVPLSVPGIAPPSRPGRLPLGRPGAASLPGATPLPDATPLPAAAAPPRNTKMPEAP